MDNKDLNELENRLTEENTLENENSTDLNNELPLEEYENTLESQDENDSNNELPFEEQENTNLSTKENVKNIITKKRLIKYTLIYLITSLIYVLMISFSKVGRFKGEVTITDRLDILNYTMIISIIFGVVCLALFIFDFMKKGFIENLSLSTKKIIFNVVDWFSVLPICVVITVACFSYLFIITPVEGHSMEPTIKNGEHVFVSYNTKIKAGSVVVLEVNEEDNANVLGTSFYIKRVIGLPGDTVEWIDGKLKINGVYKDYLPEDVLANFTINGSDDFHKENTYYYENGEKHIPENFVIPEGYYFVMGDNRNSGASHDSRKIGLIKEENIIGVATYHMNYIIPRGKIE